MNYTNLFYWLTVADNAKTMFVVFICIFTAIAGIATVGYLLSSHTDSYKGQTDEDKESQRMARKWMWWSYPFMILFWSLYVFTPDKRDALLIVAGGTTMNFLTTDSTAKQIPHELTSFVVTELKNMAKNAEVDLNIGSQKDKILEEAKDMSATELMDKMKVDSNFAKIILDK
jgi:hypothetical protein